MRRQAGLWAALGVLACGSDDPEATTGSETTASDTDGEVVYGCYDTPPQFAPREPPACTPLGIEYQPMVNMSANDNWPPCVTDDGQYHLVGDSPGTIARVEGFEEIATLLWRAGTPAPDAFTMARTAYARDEGLESRLLRREDLHAAPVPMEAWMPGVDPDKQCTVEGIPEQFPDRCAGPAKLAPIIDAAFAAGQTGDGDPDFQAGLLEGALLWFLHLSVYKEANTCATNKGKDCDSSWAYYTGGTDRAGGLGYSGMLRALDDSAHNAIFDGVSAARCWRDLHPEEDVPTLADAPPSGQALFADGWEQLDNALWHGFALIVRERAIRFAGQCGSEAAVSAGFLKIAVQALQDEAALRSEADAAALVELRQPETLTPEELVAAVDAIDALFPCAARDGTPRGP